jgi:hypothetical protein
MTTNNVARAENLVDRAHAMNERANHELPLTEAELDGIILSIRNVYPDDGQLDFDELRAFLGEVAHLSHKNWTRTGMNSEVLAKILIPQGISSNARQLLARIVQEGNWDGAARHAASNIADDLPWAVLVTGVNGIRKTTSMYQPWFTALLTEALVAPAGRPAVFDTSVLPSGQTAFFRQLGKLVCSSLRVTSVSVSTDSHFFTKDHMIATICNEEFSVLYKLTGLAMNEGQDPPRDLVRKYSDLKASIFSRYRTLSELLGVALLREAQKLKSNCMMETSGRDVAMFTYVDEFFSEGYNKLALHFIINDLSCAQESVDSRMIGEMKIGVEAVAANDTLQVIYSNAGGPYGSEVLPGVQEASDRVWNEVVLKNDGVGEDWFKATIAINAHPTKPWTAQAVRPDGTLGCIHVFEASSS